METAYQRHIQYTASTISRLESAICTLQKHHPDPDHPIVILRAAIHSLANKLLTQANRHNDPQIAQWAKAVMSDSYTMEPTP